MNKQDFLESLKNYLNGQISPQEIDMQIRYYSHYIDSQTAAGRSEAEVLSELGDPRLIGKTIVETSPASGQEQYHHSSQDDSAYSYDKPDSHTRPDMGRGCFFDTSTVVGKVKLILLTVIILAVLIALIRFAARLAIYFIPVFIILFLLSAIFKRR